MVNRLLFLSGKCLSNVFKKKSIKMKKLLAFCLMVCCAVAQAQLVTYPEGLKTGMPHNDDYTVRVRVPGVNGKTCLNIMCRWIWIGYKMLRWYSLIWAVLWR